MSHLLESQTQLGLSCVRWGLLSIMNVQIHLEAQGGSRLENRITYKTGEDIKQTQ